ncbi:MAG: family N-acetyltransferase [Marmoricola sp.]|nr:family N-acetyltransferase [Marmoricola sp.]
MTILLRAITPTDYDAVVALNERFVHLTAPMDQARLAELAGASDRADVIEVDGEFAGFVITFAAGAAYDGTHFAWFAQRYHDYCYLDRIVIDDQFQRRGLGTFVYDAVEGDCARPVLALEVNIEPPNEPSLAFHRARGYVEVGVEGSDDHRVVLMTKTLGGR